MTLRNLNITSSSLVLNSCNFSENRSFFIQIESFESTESFSIVVDNFQYFRETSNLLSPSCLLANRCYIQPFKQNVVWAFLAKKRRHQTLLYSGFSGKIEYLRRYFNRITILYKCGTWVIRFVSQNSIKQR